MLTVKERLALPLPKRMRTLERDARGYPIPFIVVRDRTGMPQFTINDAEKTEQCRRKGLCSICGKLFDRLPMGAHPYRAVDERPRPRMETWFVGGTRCFLHEHGGFLDPPVHYECGEYALRVCPFLAASRYAKRIDDAKLAPGALPDHMLIREAFMQPSLPERFGFGLALGVRYHVNAQQGGVYTVDDWRYVEWWREGEPVNAPDSGEPPHDEPMQLASD